MIVPISEGEAYQCWRWARERQGLKQGRDRGRFSRVKSSMDVHFEGIRAEYAVAKAFLLPYDPRNSPHGDGNKPDLTLPDGTTVQVKFRDKVGFDLALNSNNPAELTAQVIVLCYPASPAPLNDDIEIVGYLTREEFLRLAVERDYGYGPRLAVSPGQLEPFEVLLRESLALI